AEVESSSNGPEGDGIVPTVSAVGLLQADSTKISSGKLRIIALPQSDAGGAVDHNALTNNVLAQQKILQELTGAMPQVEDVSISAEFASLNAALQLIQLGIVDPLNYAKEAFEKLKAVLGDMGAGAQTALEQTLGYLKASVEALVSGASLNLTFANADGAFAMRIDADVDARRVTKIVLGATGTRQFIGNGASTATTADDVGLAIQQSRLGAVIYPDGTFALIAQGGAAAVGLSELTVSGNVGVVAGTASGVNEAIDVTFTDTVTISLPAATAFKVSGNLTVRTPVGSLGGNFSLQKSTAGPDGIAGNADDKAELMIGTTNSSVFLGVGDVTPDPGDDVGIRFSGTSAFILIGTDPGPSRYAFYVVSTNVGLVGLGNDFAFSGTFYSVRNTFTTAVSSRTMQVDGTTLTLSVPTNTSSFGVDNGILQTPIARLKGNFRMSMVGNELQIMASSVEVFVGDDKGTPSATDDVGVKLTGGTFIGVISPGSGYAFEAGGTAQVLNIPSLTLNGTLTMQINRLGVAINRTITLFGVTRTLNFASGVTRVGGSATLQTPGGNLTGNFAIEKDAVGELLIGATGVRIFAGDDRGTPADTTDDVGVVVQDASLALLILPDNTYAFDTGGSAALLGVPGVTLAAHVSLQRNTTGAPVHRTLTIGPVTASLDLATGVARLAADAAELMLNGQVIAGGFAIEQLTSNTGRKALRVSVNDARLEIGGSPAIATIENADGVFYIANVGLVGSASGHLALNVPGVTVASDFAMKINSGSAAVTDTFATSSGPETISWLNGTQVQGQALNADIGVLGQTLHGNFSLFRQVTADSEQVVRVNVSNASTDLGGVVSLSNGAGDLLMTSAGLAGNLSGLVTITAPGLTSSSTFGFSVNTGTSAVLETFTVGATPTTINLPAGRYLKLSATGASVNLNIGGFSQSVSGDFAFERAPAVGGGSVIRLGVNNGGTNLQVGATNIVQVANARGSLVVSNDGVAGELSADASVTVPGASLSSHVTVAINTTSAAVAESFTVGAQTIDLNLPAGPYFKIEADDATLTVAGVDVEGDFTFERQVVGGSPIVRASVNDLHLGLGDGTSDFVTVNVNSATMTVTQSGVQANVGGASVTVNVPAVQVNGTFDFAIDTTGGASLVQVNGNGVEITIAGQTLRGNVQIQSQTTQAGKREVRVGVQNLQLSLGDGATTFASITNGNGSLLIDATGVAASFGVTVALNVPGVSFGAGATISL
ncbi:MAG TPA: hypothetical protein VI282_15130, partial [Verrucomicrobiae bacterium]